jgi:hypothetical protein
MRAWAFRVDSQEPPAKFSEIGRVLLFSRASEDMVNQQMILRVV